MKEFKNFLKHINKQNNSTEKAAKCYVKDLDENGDDATIFYIEKTRYSRFDLKRFEDIGRGTVIPEAWNLGLNAYKYFASLSVEEQQQILENGVIVTTEDGTDSHKKKYSSLTDRQICCVIDIRNSAMRSLKEQHDWLLVNPALIPVKRSKFRTQISAKLSKKQLLAELAKTSVTKSDILSLMKSTGFNGYDIMQEEFKSQAGKTA